MEKFWVDAANNELYKDWVGGISRGLFFEGGLYNSAPLEKFLKQEFIDVNVQRNMTMGIVDVEDGLFKEFTDKNITQGGNLIDAMYASMSFAGFFPPAEVLDTAWFDGSGVWDLDIFSGVNRCKEAGFAEKDIVVDVIMTSSANLKEVEAEDYKSVNMLFRYLEISSYYNSMDALLRSQFAYKDANFRYVITPTGEIPSSFYPLSLNETQVEDTFAMGVKDAQDVIAKGSKQSLKDLLHYYALKKSGKGSGGRTFGEFLDAKANGELEEFSLEDHALLKKYSFMTK
uniref:PNPLA domain-containing protein n=1 Tax=Strombidium inclinatum TaxID=197538 RepID=A0A7S3IFS7_9SPIT|mmetsp:Transcript_16469/g.25419  ORF Transcript_16469/g.25419 Transcript_16469/m.25419 type:complete len:286 (+) Transcript_16469:277-1134(+)